MLHDYSEVMTEIDKSIAILRKSLPDKRWKDSNEEFFRLLELANKGLHFTHTKMGVKFNVVQTDK